MSTPSHDVVAKREAELSAFDRQLVSEWGSEAFGNQAWLRAFSWSTPDWRLFLLDSGERVSHVKLTTRVITVGKTEVVVAGIGGVMTPARFQRRGYSSRLLKRVELFIFSELAASLGLLFCLPDLTDFYCRLGWQTVKSAVYINQPSGRIEWPQSAMVLSRPDVSWKDEEIDIRGLPW